MGPCRMGEEFTGFVGCGESVLWLCCHCLDQQRRTTRSNSLNPNFFEKMKSIPAFWMLIAVFTIGLALHAFFASPHDLRNPGPRSSSLSFHSNSLLPRSPQNLSQSLQHGDLQQHRYESCLNTLATELPFAGGKTKPQQSQFAPHHYTSWTRNKWNEKIRFAQLPGNVADKVQRVLYAGGNTEASDIPGIAKLFPRSVKFDVLEPVPSFFSGLEKTTRDKYAAKYDITLHNVGFGKENGNIRFPKSALEGQSTHLSTSSSSSTTTTSSSSSSSSSSEDSEILILARPDTFLHDLELTSNHYPLLHANCEGCEYDMFEALIDTDSLTSFAVLQFSFHLYTSIDNWFTRYCKIRVEIEKDFVALDGHKQMFGWERWVRKDLGSL